MLRLKEKYQKEVIPEMMKRFGYKNPMAVPKIEKVIINTGFGRLIVGKTGEEQKKILDSICQDLALISGQKPILTKAKKSISGFKIRKGLPIGAKVTLRRKRMDDFLERLIQIALPRSRDFRGIDVSSFDKKGNLTIAIREQIAFPEVSPERTKNIFGLEITIVTNARKREEAIELFKLLGFPIKS
jgi:large subunit ribosomal protein L5